MNTITKNGAKILLRNIIVACKHDRAKSVRLRHIIRDGLELTKNEPIQGEDILKIYSRLSDLVEKFKNKQGAKADVLNNINRAVIAFNVLFACSDCGKFSSTKVDFDNVYAEYNLPRV